MKTLPISAPFWILALTMPAMADVFILKDGTAVEGKILRQDATSYLVEVNITKTIKDERTILKADVTKIQREQPDLIAFEQLAKLVPAPDLLTADEYGQRIRAVEKFLTDYRGSDKTKDARTMLATLKAEANEVIAGGIKMNGRIVPPVEYRANAYELDARIQEAKIRALIKDASYLQALRTFSDFSRDFRNTSSHAAILPLINQVITSYLAEVGQSLATYEARLKERQLGLQRMPAADRVGTENAIREEAAELEARLKAEKDAKIGWVTTHPFFKPSLEETMSFGKQETNRLATMTSAPAVDGGKAYRDALGLIQRNANAASISAAISTAKSALVAPRYIAILENAAKASGATK